MSDTGFRHHLNNGATNVPVLTTPQVVDFAQLSGLHQLLDLNAVPTGTYTSATVTIASPVIGFINTAVNPPSSVRSMELSRNLP